MSDLGMHFNMVLTLLSFVACNATMNREQAAAGQQLSISELFM